jgi:hypothetical protein
MSAFAFIARKREAMERIELVGTMRLATNGSKREVEKSMERWAREAEVRLRFEEED